MDIGALTLSCTKVACSDFAESRYGNAGLYGGEHAMQLWRSAEFVDRVARQLRADANALREHHGQQTDCESSPVRHVQLPGHPGSRRSNVGGARRSDAATVYAGHSRALGDWFTHSVHCQYACDQRLFQVDVRMGGSHTDYQSRTNDRANSLAG